MEPPVPLTPAQASEMVDALLAIVAPAEAQPQEGAPPSVAFARVSLTAKAGEGEGEGAYTLDGVLATAIRELQTLRARVAALEAP